MAVFGTSDLKVMLPRNIGDRMVTAAKSTSTVAKLSAAEPQRFGSVDYITFNALPKMEYVEEGADKASQTFGMSAVTAKPHKGQVTFRFNEEVQWADEDYQLGLLSEIADAGRVALSRGLDLGLYHRINPLTGVAITGWDNYLTTATKRVEIGTAEADADLRTAVGLLMEGGGAVNGLAMDPKFAFRLASLQNQLVTGADGATIAMGQRYPTLGFGADVTSFLGINTAVGDTVSGTPEAADTKVRAIVGDFQNGIRWGVQRELPVEIIRFGDPDGQGDLKRKNQIALRLEIVYGWYVDAARFAVVEDKVA